MSQVVVDPDLDYIYLLPRQFLQVALDLFHGVHLAGYTCVSWQHRGVPILAGETSSRGENSRPWIFLRFRRSANLKHGFEVRSEAHNGCHAVPGILFELGQYVFLGIVLT